MLVATLREVYNVSRPSRLAYAAFDAKSRVILLPTLGIDLKPRSAKRPEAPAQCRPKSPDELRAAVLAAIREFTGKSDLRLADDGTLTLTRDDNVSVFIRVPDPPATITHNWFAALTNWLPSVANFALSQTFSEAIAEPISDRREHN